MKRECPSCGSEVTGRRNKLYCNVSCQRAMNLQKRLPTRRQQYAEADPDIRRESRREYHYKSRFGITLDEYNEMWATQDRRCAICRIEQKPNQRAFAVDHDHETGEIFGILCFICNHKLIADIRTPDIYDRAAEYLRKGTGRFVPDKYKKPKRRRRRKKKNG